MHTNNINFLQSKLPRQYLLVQNVRMTTYSCMTPCLEMYYYLKHDFLLWNLCIPVHLVEPYVLFSENVFLFPLLLTDGLNNCDSS
jgi:hypothetical protein